MRLHLAGFPHTIMGDDRFSTCAYSNKNYKFSKMGWDDLVVYATEGSQVEDAELVEILSNKERLEIFGKDNPKEPPRWPTDEQWKLFNERCVYEVASRSEPGDLLLLSGGWSQHEIAVRNPHLIACEPGVGYEGIWANFVAFESYAWQHFIYGKKNMDIRWFDRVIPNYFDPNDFPKTNKGKDSDYLLFVGRVVQRKGLHAAMDIATASGYKLKVAGPGPTKWRKGKFLEAPEVTVRGNVEYLGVLDTQTRNDAMAGARALLVPTVYVEPFGGVAVEGMLSGTPVIASDAGAFTETVTPDVGFRFRTLREAVRAVEDASTLLPEQIKRKALATYSLQAVKPQFEQWFDALGTLNGKGWYEL